MFTFHFLDILFPAVGLFLPVILVLIVDSHAHLNDEAFDSDREEVLKRSFQNGISAILCPAEITDMERLNLALDIKKKHRGIFLAAGSHPHNAKNFSSPHEEQLRVLASRRSIHSIGEIGLDFHYNFSSRMEQIRVFRRQINLAKELKLPVIIHSRMAGREILQAVEAEDFREGGILHCFTEDWPFAKQMLDFHFYISFSGILTFPKALEIRETAGKIPLDRLLVETDSPYLTPVPHRGKIKRNEPLYVKETARFLAGLKKISYEEIADITSANFKNVLQLH
jgi:TatD DNase family protein